ncbi:MAG: efflux RND transporter periplasmic adaptor subunit [Alphaproteobacteria bacterium]|nr:efflux RND transporter periplasmic adaptor subunit [Alphaproteobacteria bacterium]MDE2112093.1 efflux RND transporter periplasmic adaptor subunit [Alphaproteobacteria bacterium]MDE2493891.1 efflux RND transporter periplasmic adaptor subunit [Alphaproteobacteria bacterium]
MTRVVFCFFLAVAGTVLAAQAEGASGALVKLAVVKQGTLRQVVVAYGTVTADPGGVTTVSMPRDGTIASVSVRPGATVKAGDPIATIETAPAAVVQYEQAQSTFSFAQKDLDHTRTLFGEQLATRSQLAAAEKAYSDAVAAYRQQKKIGADHTEEVLQAPAAGVVTAVGVAPGDRVLANAVVASIAARDRLVLNLGLEPEVAPSVPVGAPVWLFSPQNSVIGFSVKIASVAAMMDPQSRLVNAVVGIPKEIASRLILGMTLEGHIELPSRSGLLVPRSALMTDERGTFVYVVNKGIAHRRNVTVSLEVDSEALLTAGVSAKDQVVAVGGSGVEDGGAVRTN